MTAAQKYSKLLARLKDLDSVLVAYSGGIDSTLLAFAAHAALGPRTAAVLASSNTYPERECEGARDLAGTLGLRLIEVETSELADPAFAANAPDRCFHCKTELFSLLVRIADLHGLAHVADGSNADDRSDHRPGRQAARDMQVVSPLAEVELTKAEIRELARELGLPNWDKPSMACLASRFPYGERITDDGLERVGSAENALYDLGLTQFRVRSHGDIGRVEVAPDGLDGAWALRREIATALQSAGFTYAAIDLDGYRTGSMNEVLSVEERYQD